MLCLICCPAGVWVMGENGWDNAKKDGRDKGERSTSTYLRIVGVAHITWLLGAGVRLLTIILPIGRVRIVIVRTGCMAVLCRALPVVWDVGADTARVQVGDVAVNPAVDGQDERVMAGVLDGIGMLLNRGVRARCGDRAVSASAEIGPGTDVLRRVVAAAATEVVYILRIPLFLVDLLVDLLVDILVTISVLVIESAATLTINATNTTNVTDTIIGRTAGQLVHRLSSCLANICSSS